MAAAAAAGATAAAAGACPLATPRRKSLSVALQRGASSVMRVLRATVRPVVHDGCGDHNRAQKGGTSNLNIRDRLNNGESYFSTLTPFQLDLYSHVSRVAGPPLTWW